MFAAHVPEDVVDGAYRHHEVAVARVTIGAIHLVPEGLAGERVLADEEGAQIFLHYDRCGLFERAVEAFDATAGSYADVDR